MDAQSWVWRRRKAVGQSALFQGAILALLCPAFFLAIVLGRTYLAPDHEIVVRSLYGDGAESTPGPLSAFEVAGLRRHLDGYRVSIMRPCQHSLVACVDVSTDTGHRRLSGAFAEPDVPVRLGLRAFRGDIEEFSRHSDAALISRDTWERVFGRSEDILGRTLTVVSGLVEPQVSSARIVGVVEPTRPIGLLVPDIWLPLDVERVVAHASGLGEYLALVHLARADEVPEFLEQLPGWSASILRDHPDPDVRRHMKLIGEPVARSALSDIRGPAAVFISVLATCSLALCVGVLALQRTRVLQQERSMTIMLQLGAAHSQIWRSQAAVAVAGWIGALLLGGLGAVGVWWALSAALQNVAAVPIDAGAGSLIIVVCGVTIATMAATLIDLFVRVRHVTTAASRPGRGVNLMHAAGVLAVSCVVLSSYAAAFLGPVLQASRMSGGPLGKAIVADVVWFPRDSSNGRSPDQAIKTALDRIHRVEGVQSAAIVTDVPGLTSPFSTNVLAMKESGLRVRREMAVSIVTPAAKEILPVELVHGRWFEMHDTSGSDGVAVLSVSAAKVLFSDEETVLGRLIQAGEPRVTVVGIASDHVVGRTPLERVYLSAFQGSPSVWSLLVVPKDSSAGTRSAILDAVHTILRDDPVSGVRGVSQALSENVRGVAVLGGALATAAAVTLACLLIGVVGIVAAHVELHRRGLAVRSALGAARWHLAWLVVRPVAIVCLCAAVAGGWVVGLLGSVTESIFPEVSVLAVAPIMAVVVVLLTAVAASAMLCLGSIWKGSILSELRRFA